MTFSVSTRAWIGLSLTLLIGFAAFALPMSNAVAAPQAGAVPTWTVDAARSQVGFSASMNDTAFQGQFRRWTARIAFDPARLAQSSVVADIETGSAVTANATRDQALPTPDWFNAAAFPRARFVSTGFRSLGGNRYVATGTLTIRNVSRPVQLPFTLTIANNVAQMQGQLTLDRTVFGVGQRQFAGAEPVAKTVTVNVRISARRVG